MFGCNPFGKSLAKQITNGLVVVKAPPGCREGK